jgi:hypothetical protein
VSQCRHGLADEAVDLAAGEPHDRASLVRLQAFEAAEQERVRSRRLQRADALGDEMRLVQPSGADLGGDRRVHEPAVERAIERRLLVRRRAARRRRRRERAGDVVVGAVTVAERGTGVAPQPRHRRLPSLAAGGTRHPASPARSPGPTALD